MSSKKMELAKRHLIQKLYNRQVYGSFDRRRKNILDKTAELFTSVPERLIFPLHHVIQNMKKQIYLGTSRCGQFLITYSFTMEISHAPLAFRYRYKLHWWLYRPGSKAVKVAEVQLFDSQDIKHALSMGIAQWPKINNKLIVYGVCEDGDAPYEQEEADMDTRRYYITVTTLPSLNNCKNCKDVAESFDEEDMAANWDRAISMSCIKHGLTIHTILEIAPPYPSLDFLTNLKIDNKIIVNTGNFLHVLTFSNDQQEIKPSLNDSIVTEQLHHNIGEKLSSDIGDYICPWKSKTYFSRKMVPQSVNKAWLNTIMAQAEKLYAFEETEDGCEPIFKWFRKRRIADKMYEFCSDDDENMENICPPAKMKRYSSLSKYVLEQNQECRLLRRENDDEETNWNSNRAIIDGDIKESSNVGSHCKCLNAESLRTKKVEGDCKRRQTETLKKCVLPSDNCDHYKSNECDTQGLGVNSSQCIEKTVPQQHLVDNFSYTSDCDNFNNLDESISSPVSFQSSDDCTLSRFGWLKQSLALPITIPKVSHMLADWKEEPLPKSKTCECKNKESKNRNIQSFMEHIPGTTRGSTQGSNQRTVDYSRESGGDTGGPSPHSSNRITSKFPPMVVVLRPRNCNQDEVQKTKEPEDRGKALSNDEGSTRVKLMKDPELAMRQRMISGCSVQFDRIYIEVDEEIMSTITDIEDDDQGTGYHCALPLSVHGSAYAQLQMVSYHKAERMNIHCERVYQSSLDIDQFCFKAAEIICKCEGFKFWFCHDYDVEIIDVCALNGDILGVICLRLNAEKEPPKTERYNEVNKRYSYEVSCVFTWNPKRDRCWLEAYSHLEEVTNRSQTPWAPAKNEASKLRHTLMSFSHSSLDFHPPIRNFTHQLYKNMCLAPSLQEMIDHTNLIGFNLFKL